MARGGKATHIVAELGDNGLGRAARAPGNRVELGQRGLRCGASFDVPIAR